MSKVAREDIRFSKKNICSSTKNEFSSVNGMEHPELSNYLMELGTNTNQVKILGKVCQNLISSINVTSTLKSRLLIALLRERKIKSVKSNYNHYFKIRLF